MSKLLKLLKEKIQLLEQDQQIDYRLVKVIITYLKNYSDKYHHPLEDMIYDYYLKYRVVPDTVANRLSQEHQLIKEATIELDELLEMILLDAVVPKEQCIDRLKHFVNLQSAHMNYEEKEILPQIEASLSKEDWRKLKEQWQDDGHSDPLFGEKISEQYKELANRIKQNS